MVVRMKDYSRIKYDRWSLLTKPSQAPLLAVEQIFHFLSNSKDISAPSEKNENESPLLVDASMGTQHLWALLDRHNITS